MGIIARDTRSSKEVTVNCQDNLKIINKYSIPAKQIMSPICPSMVFKICYRGVLRPISEKV